MTVVSGVISRQVLPACDNLCFFCPALRTRSRQPVKRYKHLISDIFPRSQDEEVNERKIGKLCDYASKNPLRIPKVWFMGENSHISVEFDNIVSVVLENYKGQSKECSGSEQNGWVQEVNKAEGYVSPSLDAATRVPSWRIIINEKGQLNVATEVAKSPQFWSRVCLQNMANLGKEATTMRRVLESLFRYFDSGNLWPVQGGIAFPVLKDMQLLMDDSGSTHLLLSILVKHLDHKNVLKQPDMQLDVVEVVTALAQLTKIQSSVPIVSAVSDIMRHLRKSIHYSLDDANLGDQVINWNRRFHEVVDECLTELTSKVGDAGQILDVMASMLENISSITMVIMETTRLKKQMRLILLFSRAKTSYRDALIRSFQLAFTLRAVSLQGGTLPASRRRSLYVLSSSMIIFSAKVYNLLPLIPVVKAAISDKVVDPFLCLVEDSKLEISESGLEKQNVYGSKEDNTAAVRNLENVLEYEEAAIREQLVQDFVPDEMCSLGSSQMYNDNAEHGRESNFKGISGFGMDDDGHHDRNDSNAPHNSKLTVEFPNLLSVDQLLQSILETAHHVGRMSVSTGSETSYRDVANHCESLQQGKQQKMTLLTIASRNAAAGAAATGGDKSHGNAPKGENANKILGGPPVLCATEYQNNPVSFRLPSSSPYDNFLKAAGC
ncbi:protein SEMI-ROLLED LEAF 2-like [Salvia divinorum]|uniref:Protein SEMI-ROLLED LEAF 2-like n=1 Tax=Salvia divinorum TaxID=28513 RepID=A0ABD1HDX2_SALDI